MTREEELISELIRHKQEMQNDFGWNTTLQTALDAAIAALKAEPCEDKGEISDGYHTFNQLYHQRAVLFATIVNQNKSRSWKSYKHSDGQYCFDSNGEWFIVGVDTPKGNYTYHYSKEYWNMFDCKELECGKEWDGHTEEDVTRLLSLQQEPCEDADNNYPLNMPTEEYRLRMIRAFHNADCDELIALVVMPTEKEFEQLEGLLKTHYKKQPCEDCVSRTAVIELAKKGTLISNGNFKSVCEAINNLPRVYPTLPTMVYPQVPGVTPCVVPDYKGGWRLNNEQKS